MYVFKDFYRNEVKLSFDDHPFSKRPKHVWVICRFAEKWLVTEHKERGLEFPGGKVEEGETAAQAAIREVMEETGGQVQKLTYIGQYHVAGKREDIVKNVYFAEIEEITERDNYFETKGPVKLDAIPQDIRRNKAFSFVMKDDVLTLCLQEISALGMI